MSAETQNHAMATGVDIAPDGTVWAIGYRYADRFGDRSTARSFGEPWQNRLWVAAYLPIGSAQFEYQLFDPSHDITSRGVVGTVGGGFFATANSANTVLRTYVFGRDAETKSSLDASNPSWTIEHELHVHLPWTVVDTSWAG